MGKRITDKEFCFRLKSKFGNKVQRIDKYITCNYKIRFRCNVCGNLWKSTPYLTTHKEIPCPKCSKLIQNKRQCYSDFEVSEIIKSYTNTFKFIKRQDDMSILVKCLNCGREYSMLLSNIRQQEKCNCWKASIGEQIIYSCLKCNGVSFKYQYGTIINNHQHYFDFYLAEMHLMIEYDGEQHYNKHSNWYRGGERDEEKNQWCKKHNIKLIRVPYKYKSIEDITMFLSNKLVRHLCCPNGNVYSNDHMGTNIAKYYSKHSMSETIKQYDIHRTTVNRIFHRIYGMSKDQYLKNNGIPNKAKKRKAIYMYKDGEKTFYESIRLCSRLTSIDARTIRRSLSKGKRTQKGYKFEYA